MLVNVVLIDVSERSRVLLEKIHEFEAEFETFVFFSVGGQHEERD